MPRASINPLAQTSRLDLNGPFASAKSPAIRRTREKVVERIARRHFARGDMRNGIVTGAAQRGCRLDVMAIIVAGQEGDRHIRAPGKIIPQLAQLMPTRGDLDGGG